MGFRYWARYAVREPRDFAFHAPRRLACIVLGLHSIVCEGRPDHRHLRRRA